MRKTITFLEKEIYLSYKGLNALIYVLNFLVALIPATLISINSALVQDFYETGGFSHLIMAIVIIILLQIFINGAYNVFLKYPQDHLYYKALEKLKSLYLQKSAAFSLKQMETEHIRQLQEDSKKFIEEKFDEYHFEKYFLFRLLITCLSMSISLFRYHFLLPLITVIAIIPIVMVRLKMNQRSFLLDENQQFTRRETDYLNSILLDKYMAADVKTWQIDTKLIGQIKNRETKLIQDKFKLMFKNGILESITESGCTMLAFFVSIFLLLSLLLTANLEIAAIITVIESIFLLQEEFINLVFNFSYMETALRWADKYKCYLDFESETIYQDKEIISGLISLKNINFKYDKDSDYVLKNINLSIKNGEKIAIVGINGSGKSTLAKLIQGLYVPTKGTIITREDAQIKSIIQDYSKYEFAIKENIVFGDIQNMNDDVRYHHIKDMIDVNHFIDHLKQKDATKVGSLFPDSANLSGGQWQILSIARGFYSNYDLLIMDEPNAALDPITESKLFDQILDITKHQSLLIISHRLLCMPRMDKIIYMENGEIKEEGTHEALMKQKGEYYKLYKSQNKWYE